MFIGHFGVAFGAKRITPRVSLGTLFLASQFIDLLWPTLLIAGLERVRIEPGITRVTPLDFTSYPISHSLLAVAGWGLLFGIVYWIARRHALGAVVLGVAVMTHWLLDLIVHRPDLPLTPFADAKVGFGLWSSLTATLVVELAIFLTGIVLYFRMTIARDRIGTFGAWGLVLFLGVIYAANLFGPPPPDARSIAVAGHAQWLLVLWAYWIDRHRIERAEPQAV